MVSRSAGTFAPRGGRDPQNAIFEALADARRRFILQHLRGAETPIQVSELAREIAAWEVQQPVAERGGGDSDAIEVSLLHVHLPKMAEAAIVEYDTSHHTVALSEYGAEAQQLLQSVGHEGIA